MKICRRAVERHTHLHIDSESREVAEESPRPITKEWLKKWKKMMDERNKGHIHGRKMNIVARSAFKTAYSKTEGSPGKAALSSSRVEVRTWKSS